MSGIISRDAGGSWISARDNVIIKTTRTSGEGSDWHPAVGIKTSSGFWTFGSVGGEHLGFSYDTDANYSTNNNTSTVISMPLKSGTIALTSDLGSYLPLSGGTLTGCLYFNQLGNGADTYIGHGNTSWMHFISPVSFYFSNNIAVDGNITQYSTGYTWIHSGNISSQTVANATNCVQKSGDTMSGALGFGNDSAAFRITTGTSGSNSPLRGIKLPATSSNFIGIFARPGKSTDEGGILLSEDTCIVYNSHDTGYGFMVVDTDLSQSDWSAGGAVAFKITDGHTAWSLGGFVKSGSDDNYFLTGGGGHVARSGYATTDTACKIQWSGSVNWANTSYLAAWTNSGLIQAMPKGQVSVAWSNVTGKTTAVFEENNSWLTPARVQILRKDTTVYTDRSCIGTTDGNLHIDPYKNKGLYLNYYSSDGNIYFNGSTYYINGGYYNGTAAAANSVTWGNVTSKPAASGNATTPVYWNGSGFTNCTAYGSASVNYANSAGSAGSATSLGSGLTHMCSGYFSGTYSAYKITTNWHKSENKMPTINIRGYAYGSSKTIDADIVMYHYSNVSCNYGLVNKGSYPIRVWTNIENDIQVYYISPGEYYGMFNVFVYHGMGTSAFSGWTITTVDSVAGTEIGKSAIATDITGNAGSASSVAWDNVSSKPATATRWPAWSEVTSKPSVFTPASHTHDYLPLSGGTMTGDLTTTGVWASGTSNRLVFRHLDGQNCDGDYALYLQYYNSSSPVYFCGASSYISGSYFSGTANYANSAGSVSWSNVTSKPTLYTNNYLPENTAHYFRDPNNGSWRGGMFWGSASTESMSFVVVNSGTRFQFVCGSDIAGWDSGTWQSASPACTIAASSATFAGSVYSNSDRCLKKNISSIPASSLERLFSVSSKLLKKFTWKDPERDSYGFIAQELEKYIPEAITSDEKGIKSVSYDIAYAKILASIIHEIEKIKKSCNIA